METLLAVFLGFIIGYFIFHLSLFIRSHIVIGRRVADSSGWGSFPSNPKAGDTHKGWTWDGVMWSAPTSQDKGHLR